ncbi:MAG: TolC family protein [Lysobacterales bacterium]|jgi:outer membrane protein TolC
MRGVVPAIVVAALCTVAPCLAETIDFSQAVARAWAANPRSQASSAREQAASGQVRAARGKTLPDLSVQFNAARSNDPVQVFGYRLAQRDLTFSDFGLGSYTGREDLGTVPAELNHPGYANNFDSAVILTVPLFASGGNRARVRAAEARLAAASSGAAATKSRLTFEVLRNYDGVTATRLLLEAASAARRAAEQDLKTARALFKRGMTIESDVLTARANLERAGAAEKAAAAELDNALDAFRTVIAAPADSALKPAAAVDVTVPEATLDALQKRAVAANPQVQAMRHIVAARAAEHRAAKAANGPRVDLVARHDWNADTPALRAPSNTLMGVVSWDLFTAGARRGDIEAAGAEWRAAQADLAAAEDAIRLDVVKRRRAVQVAAAQAQAAAVAASQAAEAARLLDLRYSQGLTPLDDLLNAQARRDQSRAEAVAAAYRAVLARAALLLAVDRLDPARAVLRPLVPKMNGGK